MGSDLLVPENLLLPENLLVPEGDRWVEQLGHFLGEGTTGPMSTPSKRPERIAVEEHLRF